MRLRTLSAVCLTGAFLGLIAVLAYGAYGWSSVSSGLENVERMRVLHRRVKRLSLAVDYINLLRHDPAVLEAIHDDAMEIREQLEEIGDPGLRVASAHLVEIASMSRSFREILGQRGVEAVEETLERQFRIHQSGATTSSRRP